jgi:hypothetical protein
MPPCRRSSILYFSFRRVFRFFNALSHRVLGTVSRVLNKVKGDGGPGCHRAPPRPLHRVVQATIWASLMTSRLSRSSQRSTAIPKKRLAHPTFVCNIDIVRDEVLYISGNEVDRLGCGSASPIAAGRIRRTIRPSVIVNGRHSQTESKSVKVSQTTFRGF